MTVREIYERGIKDLPPTEQLRLASLILEQLTQAATTTEELRELIRQRTPSNDTLLSLAATHNPPQSWWDENDDPTTASAGE